MKLKEIVFEAEACVTFTEAEVKLLLLLSAHHYDGVCREVGQEGGFLFGIKNRMETMPGTYSAENVFLKPRQLDTLMKILEGAPVATKRKGDQINRALDLSAELRAAFKLCGVVSGLAMKVRQP